MANTKTLNTRIQLKYDTFAEWTDKNPKLLKGEIAVVYIPAQTSAGKVTQQPATVFKVGDGEHLFNDLPFSSSLAADVYAWAKKEQGAAEDIKVLTDGHTFNGKTVSEALKTLNDNIGALTGDGTSGSISDMITSAINNLDVNDTVEDGKYISAISQVDGKIVITRASLPDYSNVYAAKSIESTVAKIDADYLKTADKTALETAIGQKVDKENGKSLISDTEIERLASVENYDDTGVKASIKTNADAISAIKDGTTINSFKGVEDTLTNTYATKTEAQGWADEKDTAIAAAKKAGDDAQADVDALEVIVNTLVGTDNNKSVRTISSEEVAKIVAGADTAYDTLKEIADWISSHSGSASEMNSAILALQAIVDGIGGEGEKATVVAYVNDAIDALKIGDYAKATELAALASRVTTAEGNITTLEGQAHTHGNKDLLDTYTQTEANLADAVSKKHDHTNKTDLDKITSEKISKWDAAEQNAKKYVDDQFATTLILNCGSASTILDTPTTT